MDVPYVPFKIRYDIDERRSKFKKVKGNPALSNMILIILEPHPKSTNMLFNNYFSCEGERTVLYLVDRLRKKIGGQAS